MSGRSTPALAVGDLVVDFGGARVVDGVGFEVPRGAWFTLIGPNGAGKTTVMRAVAGLVSGGGSIELAGRRLDTTRRRERARRVAYVPQNPVTPVGMTVLDYVLLGRTPYIPLLGREARTDYEVAHDALAQLDLAGHTHRALDTLSGGELQRTLLARGLAQRAPLLLLDEPTMALDIGHQQEVLDVVDELRRARGLTVVSTMHDLVVAGEYADELALLYEGRIVAQGEPARVLTEGNVVRFYRARVKVLREGFGPVVVPVRDRERIR